MFPYNFAVTALALFANTAYSELEEVVYDDSTLFQANAMVRYETEMFQPRDAMPVSMLALDEACAWRQTGDCSPTGPREPESDKSCFEQIPSDNSGYCDCNANEAMDEGDHGYNCDSTPNTCAEICLVCDESLSGDGEDYRGCQDRTITGRICQKWTSQSPHAHSMTVENKPDSGLGNHNYCRNPDGFHTIWCYTLDPNVRFEECTVLSPTPSPSQPPPTGQRCGPLLTPLDTTSGGNATYFDRHNLACDANQYMSTWQLRSPDFNNIQFVYTCCDDSRLSSCVQLATPENEAGAGDVRYFDRHTVECNENRIISQWNYATPREGTMSFEYTCCSLENVASMECRTLTTGWEPSENGDSRYLDRHAVECESHEAMTKWHLTTSGSDMRVEYDCCTVITASPTPVPTQSPTPSPTRFVFQSLQQLQSALKFYTEDPEFSDEVHGPLSDWDVSRIKTMYNLLSQSRDFNGDISGWNTSMVTDIADAFFQVHVFNQDLDQWNVAKVTTLSLTFYDATSFNGAIGQWDVSQVQSLRYTFWRAPFNQAIGQWNVAKAQVSTTFDSNIVFNQDLGQWNTASWTHFGSLFLRARSFNGDVSEWNTTRFASGADDLFAGARPFNRNLGQWNTAKTRYFGYMFRGDFDREFEGESGGWTTSFNQPIGQWNTAASTGFSDMFRGSSAFNQDIGQWNTAASISFSGMFRGASAFNQDIGQWNTVSGKDFSQVIRFASAFNQDIGQWNTLKHLPLPSLQLEGTAMSECNKHLVYVGWENAREALQSWSNFSCSAELSQPTVQNDVPLGFDLSVSTLATNNLGGTGPQRGGAGVLRFEGVTGDGSTDLIVSNLSKYVPSKSFVNGLSAGGTFAQINLDCGEEVDLLFQFSDRQTQEPKLLPNFTLTIADLDMGTQDRCQEAIEIAGFTDVKLSPDTTISESVRTGGLARFVATAKGTQDDNPESLNTMSKQQRDKSVSFSFTDKDSFRLTFFTNGNVESYSKTPAVVGYGGRRMLFSAGMMV